MRTRMGVTTLVLAVTLVAAVPAGAERTQRTISVSGTAETRVLPDAIVWRVTVSDFDKDLLAAKNRNDAKMKAIFALVEELDVEPENVQTGQLSVNREYERDEHGNRKEFKHFAVTRSLKLTQRDLTRFDEFLTKLVSSGEMEVSFNSVSDRFEELRMQTRLDAVRIAKQKAETMLEVLGARLGPVLTVEEPKPRDPYSRGYSNVAFTAYDAKQVADMSSGTFAPSAIAVQVTVNATFAID